MTQLEGLSYAEHCVFSATFNNQKQSLLKMNGYLQSHYDKSDPIYKKMNDVVNAMKKLGLELDDDYHNVTSEIDFQISGHVYSI